MAVSEDWFLDKIILPSSVEFQAYQSGRIEAGIMTLIERGAGEVHPNFIATQLQKPSFNFSTTQIGTLLSNVPLVGLSVASATFYLKKGATTGRVARATSSHKKVAATTCLVYWSSIRLPHNGTATADVIIQTIYDGTNEPFIHTGSIALSGSETSQDFFGAGPVYINGTAYADVQEIVVNSGIELVELGGSSEPYNTAVGIRTTEPSTEVKMLRSINWPTIGPTGLALSGNGFLWYGRKYSADGQRVAATTAGHVGGASLSGRVIPLNTSGDGANQLVDHFRVESRYNSTPDTSMNVSGATKIDGDPTFSNA